MRRLFALICMLAAVLIWAANQQPPSTVPVAVVSLSANTPDATTPPDNSTASEAPTPKPWGSDTAPISTAASALYLKNHAATPLPALAFAAMTPADGADEFTHVSRALHCLLMPVHALFASGRLLRRLHEHFGNLGLAAAAYNAGPQRIHDWMAVRRGLPAETRDYVRRITGHQAERWLSREFARGPEAALMPARAPCAEVAEAVREQTHIVRVARLMAELAAATVPPPPQDQSRVAALPAKPAGKQAAVEKKKAPAQKQAVAAQTKPQMARAMKDQSRPIAAQGSAKVAPVASTQTKKRIAAQ